MFPGKMIFTKLEQRQQGFQKSGHKRNGQK